MTDRVGKDASNTAESYSDHERRVYATFMIVAPLILLVATIVHPPHGIQSMDGPEYFGAAVDHTTAFYIGHTGFFLTGATLIVAVIGLTRLVSRTHPKAGFWGLVLSAMGFVGWGAIDGMDFMTFNAGRYTNEGGLDFDTMQTYITDALSDNLVLIPVFGIFMLAIIGLVVTAIGLHRADVLHLGWALLLPIGVAGVISFLDYAPLEIASGVCVCLSVIPVGVRLARGTLQMPPAYPAAE